MVLRLLGATMAAIAVLVACNGRHPAGPADDTPPTVEIVWPLEGGTTSSIAEVVQVVASDDQGVERIEIRVDGDLLAVLDTLPYRALWLTADLNAGDEHVIAARAEDAAGNRTDTEIAVVIGERVLERLTMAPEDDDTPRWSPDGSHLAVAATRSGNEEIMLLTSAGDSLGVLAPHPARDTAPTWSPTGTAIVFASQRTGNWDLFRVAVGALTGGGSEAPVPLTSGSADDQNPSWSADGAWIAFDSDRSLVRGIWRVSAAGGTPQVVDAPTSASSDPVYGATDALVFASARLGNLDLWSLDPGAALPRAITGYAGVDRAPSFAPTGSHLVYVTEQFGNPELAIVPLEGGTPVRLTNHLADDDSPDWSPDGRSIAFISDRAGTRDVWIMR